MQNLLLFGVNMRMFSPTTFSRRIEMTQAHVIFELPSFQAPEQSNNFRLGDVEFRPQLAAGTWPSGAKTTKASTARGRKRLVNRRKSGELAVND